MINSTESICRGYYYLLKFNKAKRENIVRRVAVLAGVLMQRVAVLAGVLMQLSPSGNICSFIKHGANNRARINMRLAHSANSHRALAACEMMNEKLHSSSMKMDILHRPRDVHVGFVLLFTNSL